MRRFLTVLRFMGWLFFIFMAVLFFKEKGSFLGLQKLAKGYDYYEENKCIRGPNNIYIPERISDYKFNEDFITARQIPDPFPSFNEKEVLYPDGRDQAYFWLIVVSNTLVIGPVTKDEFKNNLKKYQVPKELDLTKN